MIKMDLSDLLQAELFLDGLIRSLTPNHDIQDVCKYYTKKSSKSKPVKGICGD